MAKKIKVGIIWGGGILGAHMRGFPKVADVCEIAAVAEVNPDQDSSIRQRVGPGPRIVRDYREILAMPDVAGVDILLNPLGMVVFEDPYLGDILEKTSYDQIYDEHAFYFSAASVSSTFRASVPLPTPIACFTPI